MHRGRTLVWVSSLLALTLAFGCKRVMREVAQKAEDEISAPSDEDRATSLYATGFNALIDDPQDLIETYFRSIPVAGPTGKERYSFMRSHTFAETKLAEARKAFDEAKKLGPESLAHIVPLADEALAQIATVTTRYAEAKKYYDAEDYKDDQLAKGKALHAQIVQAAEAFQTAIRKLESELSKVEDKRMQAEIAELGGDKSYPYMHRILNFKASQLLRASPANFAASYAAFEASYQELQKFSSGRGAELNTTFKSYIHQVDDFYGDAKKLRRALEASKPGEEPRDLDNLREQLTSSYNTLVSYGNSMRQLEANDLLK